LAKRLAYSRWKRLPGLFRTGQAAAPAEGEPRRLILYLPEGLADRAEEQAMAAGFATVQEYCERLLADAVGAEDDRRKIERAEVRRGHLHGLDAIASDPEYLAEWSASAAVPAPAPATSHAPPVAHPVEDGRAIAWATGGDGAMTVERPAIDVVSRHAADGLDDPGAILPALRRGEPIPIGAAGELLAALVTLEEQLSGEATIERRLAYALHRLAFEGQVLLTDAYPGVPAEAETVESLRSVQEAVARVLSGQDVRYRPGPEPLG